MKAMRYHQFGPPEALVCEELERPVPRPGQVLIRVEACGVNFADAAQRGGTYPVPIALPATPGLEVYGPVEAAGEGVDPGLVGREVYAIPFGGGYAQYCLAAAEATIPAPPGLEPADGLALLIQGLTAGLIFKRSVRLKPGESVLVQAAAGGVGTLALQLARVHGAGRVIGAVGGEAKRGLVLELGADGCVDYRQAGWPDEVRRLTDGKGVDLILEMTGGRVFEQSFDAMAEFGRMVVFGFASGEEGVTPLHKLALGNREMVGFYLPRFLQEPGTMAQTFGELAGLVLEGRIKVARGEAFALEDAAEMHRRIEARQTTGKVVLLPWAQ